MFCDDFIQKPVQAQELSEKLETHLGLKWRYGDGHSTASATAKHKESFKEEGRVPPTPELDILYGLAELGNFHELNKRIAGIEQSKPRSLPFVQKIRALAENFQGEEICEFLEQLKTSELE